MKRYIIAAITILAFVAGMVSCTGRKVIRQLDDFGSYINENPDSALFVLDSMSAAGIQGREANAKFALLYSMALDKSYIDVDNDSIIAPAVRWYRHHGSSDDKLKTLYYLGRTYGNAGNAEDEMKSYVKAEKYTEKAGDLTAVGMLYSAKGRIYSNIYSFDDAIENYILASDCYQKDNNISKYINSIFQIAGLYSMTGKPTKADSVLARTEPYRDRMSVTQKSSYYSILLSVSSGMETDNLITEYLTEVPDSAAVNWMAIAESYYNAGQIDKGINALGIHAGFTPFCDISSGYQALKADLYGEAGLYKTAYEALTSYVDITGIKDLNIFKGETKSIEDIEGFKSDIRIQRLWLAVMLLSIIIISLVSALIIIKLRSVSEKRKKEKAILEERKKHYMDLFNQAKREMKNLQKIADANTLDENIKTAVLERLNILHKFIGANISPGLSKSAAEELQKLMDDQAYFLESTRLSFTVEHPAFIRFLKRYNLTDAEISYCCLYCLGLNGNEIGSFLHRKSFYNISSVIRKKLNLEEYKTNLDIFLKEKMRNLN